MAVNRLPAAFASTWQMGGFLGALVLSFVLPIVLSIFDLPLREQQYSAIPLNNGPVNYLRRVIFEDRSDLDIAFVGSSLLWVAIDTPSVQRALSQHIGKEAKVATLGFNWRGEDLEFTIMKDLLSHRHVKMIVVSMPTPWQTNALPHSQLFRLTRASDVYVERNASFVDRARLFAGAVLGGPRALLSSFHLNPLEPSAYDETLGAYLVKEGYRGAEYTEKRRLPPAFTAEDALYSELNSHDWRFTEQSLNIYQQHYVDELSALLRSYGVPLTIVHVPVASEIEHSVVEERVFWPRTFGANTALIGIPPTKLFATVPQGEQLSLYYNEHLNANGNFYFTAAILPALIKCYDRLT